MRGFQRLNISGKLFHIFAAIMFLYLLLPVVLAVLVSFTPSRFIELPKSFSLRWYIEFFDSAKWLNGLKNSFYIGLMNTLISMVVGMCTAIAFVRYKFKWKTALNTFVLVPVFIPAVILGMGLLSAYYKLHLWGTYVSIAIAHSLWSVPLVFMVLRVSLAGVDRTLEEAAQGLGANGLRTFYEVTLPLIMPGILVGILFSFIISINEFVMALFLTTSETETLPKVIWPNLRYLLTPLVAAASGVLTLLTIIGLIVSAKLFNLGKILAVKR
jgi:ABC-type spermidine/putrescine transport system permease subunit II